uniref:Uncharacterized protein n=1 Tax=Sinocyclocheilus rhinocerous TaxID=307959 RepID=A0A673FF48_9TELE
MEKISYTFIEKDLALPAIAVIGDQIALPRGSGKENTHTRTHTPVLRVGYSFCDSTYYLNIYKH